MDGTDRGEERSSEKSTGRLSRAAEQTRETMEKAKEGLAAGASGVAEATRRVADETRDRAGRVADFVKEAETDAELKARVTDRTERVVDRAGERLSGAAPAIGRGAEWSATKTGQALHALARPLGVVLGTIAGTVGGWWKKASEERFELPETDEMACREHFTALAIVPGDLTYERARTGYALGYVASRNPGYAGREFEEIEPDLRQGFGEEHARDYETLREFTRYGYSRGQGA